MSSPQILHPVVANPRYPGVVPSTTGVDRAAHGADAPSDFLIAGLRVRLGDVDEATRGDFESRLPEFRVEPEGEAEITLIPAAARSDMLSQLLVAQPVR